MDANAKARMAGDGVLCGMAGCIHFIRWCCMRLRKNGVVGIQPGEFMPDACDQCGLGNARFYPGA